MAFDKMQVEASSSMGQANNIPIPEVLIIVSNLKIQGIINDESPVPEVRGAGPVAVSGGEVTSSAVVSITEEPARP